MAREAGAKKVYFASCSPAIRCVSLRHAAYGSAPRR